LEFSQALMRLQLKQREDPSSLFTQIADLSNRYGVHDFPEQQVIAVIMNAVPPEYRAVIANELRTKQEALTLDEVEDALESYQRHVHPHKESKKADRSDTPEITLSAVAAAPKGACWKCGKKGHQKKDCRSGSGYQAAGNRANNKINKTTKECERCGKVAHLTADCWRDPRNSDKRPEWLKLKLKNDKEVSGVNASTFEVLCCSICVSNLDHVGTDTLEDEGIAPPVARDVVIHELTEDTEVCMEMQDQQLFPKALKLLSDPNFWIGDTGASVDVTPVSEGMTDSRPCNVSVHVGNSEHTSATYSGSLSVTVCDNAGVELFDASFPDMHLVPQAPYNIISITQRMESGWELAGDKHAGIILKKHDTRMCFDIRIETAKGVLWAICMKRKVVETAAVASVISTPISIQQAHLRLGHRSEVPTRKAAKALGWRLLDD
jgi:hypothetical protein